MFTDDELIPISALQHWAFCPRQCALIHLDRIWEENARTASGRLLHNRTHDSGSEMRDGVRIVRSLHLRSGGLGLIGMADVVEFHPATPETPPNQQISLPETPNRWSVRPIEYKRGRPKANDCDRLQLTAQALCLEEMLNVSIPAGELYYGQRKRRTHVDFSAALRAAVEDTTQQIRKMLTGHELPAPNFTAKCKSCSLRQACMPERAGRQRPIAENYLSRMIEACLADAPTEDLP